MPADEGRPEDGGELQFGVTYTLWIPDGAAKLRGVIVHQHGCGRLRVVQIMREMNGRARRHFTDRAGRAKPSLIIEDDHFRAKRRPADAVRHDGAPLLDLAGDPAALGPAIGFVDPRVWKRLHHVFHRNCLAADFAARVNELLADFADAETLEAEIEATERRNLGLYFFRNHDRNGH